MTKQIKGLKKFFKGFSLVELIIVIAIVAILSVAGFLTLQKRISQSRDSKRLGDLETIEKSLTVNYTDQDTAELYPMPDGNNDGSGITSGEIDGEIVAYKGTFGSGAIEQVDSLNEVPVEPLDDERYAYGVTEDQKYFQIAAVLENGEKVSYRLTNRAYAADKKSVVRGNYDGLMVYTSGESNYISNIPSLIFNGTGNLSNTGVVSYVVDGSSNLAYGEDTSQNESFEEVVRKTYGLSGDASVSFVNTGTDSLKKAIEDGNLSDTMKNSLGGNEGVIESKLEESGVSVDSSNKEITCEDGYFPEGGECKLQWTGDGSSSRPFLYKDNSGTIQYPKSCNDILTGGETEYEKANISGSVTYSGISSSDFKNGVYQIDPNLDGTGFNVYCDMNTDGGGWTRLTWNFNNYEALANNEIPVISTDKGSITNTLVPEFSFSEIKGTTRFVLGGSLDGETLGWYLGGYKLMENHRNIRDDGCPSDWIRNDDWNTVAPSYDILCYKDKLIDIDNYNNNSIDFDFSLDGCTNDSHDCGQDINDEYFGGHFINNYFYLR